VKLDQGFKSLLRGIRKAFKASFAKTKVPKLKNNGEVKLDRHGKITYEAIEKGKHHWVEERWFYKANLFLETHGIFKAS
jgi:hypothetical protein